MKSQFLPWIESLKKKNKDIHFTVSGNGLKADDLYHFLHNSYQKKVIISMVIK